MNFENFTNLTYNADAWLSREQFRDTVFSATAVTGVLLAVCIIVTNGSLITLIATSRKLRTHFRYQMIVNIAVSDFLVGAIYCPLKVDLVMKKDWEHGCVIHLLFQITDLYIQVFVSLWGLVILNIDYLLELFYCSRPQLSALGKTLLSVALIALPWVSACTVVVPVVLMNLHPLWTPFLWSDGYCPVVLVKWASITLPALVFFIPASVLLIQATIMFISKISLHGQIGTLTTELLSPSPAAQHTSVFLIGSFLTVSMLFGAEVGHMLVDKMRWKTVLISGLLFGTVSDLKACLFPLLWILLPDVREAIKQWKKWRPWRKNVASDLHVTYYRNYGEDLSP